MCTYVHSIGFREIIPHHVLATEVATFFAAGYETSSTATTWALFALTQAPQCQVKLREELLSLATDTPSMEELNNLPYLDAVVRETLRVHSPAPMSARVAKEDDVIPLEIPFVDVNGKMQTDVKITKGDSVMIPIQAVNKSEKIWGKDASQFRYRSLYSLRTFHNPIITGQSDGNRHQMPPTQSLVSGATSLHSWGVRVHVSDTSLLLLR